MSTRDEWELFRREADSIFALGLEITPCGGWGGGDSGLVEKEMLLVEGTVRFIGRDGYIL